MCIMTSAIDQKLASVREELAKARSCRREARSKHEQKQEALFYRLAYTQKQMEFRRKNSSSLAKYTDALITCDSAVGPYMLRKQATLLQAFHQTEMRVKQLQMMQRQHRELSTWMQQEGDRLYEEKRRVRKDLEESLQVSANGLHALEQEYKAKLRDLEDEILTLNPEDCEDQASFLEEIPWHRDDEPRDESSCSSGSGQTSKGILGPLASSASDLMFRIISPSISRGTPTHGLWRSDSVSSVGSSPSNLAVTASPRNVNWINTASFSRKPDRMSRLEEVVVLPSL